MSNRLTPAQAIARLAEIDMPHDPEEAHAAADLVLLDAANERVAAAYRECVKRTGRWWFA